MRVIAADCNRKRLSGVDRSAVFCAVQHLLIPAFPSLPHRFSTSCPQHSTPFPGPPPFARQRRKNRCTATLPQSPYLASHSRCHAQTAHTPHQVSHTFSTYSYTHFHNPNLCLSTTTGPFRSQSYRTFLSDLTHTFTSSFRPVSARTYWFDNYLRNGPRTSPQNSARKALHSGFPNNLHNALHNAHRAKPHTSVRAARKAFTKPINPTARKPFAPPFHRFSTIPPHGLSPPPSGSHKPSAALTNQRFHTQSPPGTPHRFAPYTTSVCTHFPHVFHISSMPVHTPCANAKPPPSQSGKRGIFHGNVIRKRDGRSSAPSTKRNRQGQW